MKRKYKRYNNRNSALKNILNFILYNKELIILYLFILFITFILNKLVFHQDLLYIILVSTGVLFFFMLS